MYYYPFDSESIGTDEVTGLPLLDRAQHGYQLQDFFSKMFNSGIMPNIEKCFQVEPGSGMSVSVNPGVCFVAGAIGIEPSLRTLVVQSAESQDRVDAVVIRKNNNRAVRSVDLYVKKGTPSINPKPPALQRDTSLNNASGVFEIALAYIYVSKNTSNIPAHRITDKRYNNTVCGVSSPYNKVDTTEIFKQYEAEWEQFKGQIGQDAAANIQIQLNELSGNVKKTVDSVNALYTESVKTVPELLKIVKVGKFVDATLVKSIYEQEQKKNDFYGEECLTSEKWNGKPVYTKTLATTRTVTSEKPLDLPLGVTVNEVTVDLSLSTLRTLAGNIQYPISTQLYEGRPTGNEVWWNTASVRFKTKTNWNENWKKTIVIKYTKK